VPVKSASIRVASAVPTLPKVPRHPRGELNSPWVLICVGGLLAGERAVDPVVSIVSHGWVERIVARKDCMFRLRNNLERPRHVAAHRRRRIRIARIDLNRHGAAPCAGDPTGRPRTSSPAMIEKGCTRRFGLSLRRGSPSPHTGRGNRGFASCHLRSRFCSMPYCP
jgi:hypothetical protein